MKKFDENYLNGLTGEEYSGYLKLVNEYSERILTSVYDLNNAMEELSVKSINKVIDALIESIQITNVIYAMGMGGLTDSITRATSLVDYAKFIQTNTTPLYEEISKLYFYLELGRIGKAESEYSKVLSKINDLKKQFESRFVKLTPVLPSDHVNYEIQSLAINYFEDVNERLSVKYSDDSRSADSIASGMQFYLYTLFKSTGTVTKICSDNTNLEAKSNLDCKVAKELSVFYSHDLTELTPKELALISPGYSEGDAILDRIRLIEGKIDQMYIVDGDQ